MGTLNNCFFPYSKRIKAVISLVFAHKGNLEKIVFQTALICFTAQDRIDIIRKNDFTIGVQIMMYEGLSSVERRVADEFLSSEKTGVLSMIGDDGFPYAIPINFHHMKESIYMHGRLEGTKMSILKNKPKAQFTVFREFAYIPSYASGTVACSAGYFFLSVLFTGEIRFVESSDEKVEILSGMMKKYQPEGRFDRMDDMSVYRKRIDLTSVFFLKPERTSVKLEFGQRLPPERYEKTKEFLSSRDLPGDRASIEIMNLLRVSN